MVGCGEKGNLLHCEWECKLAQPLRKTIWKLLKKKKKKKERKKENQRGVPTLVQWVKNLIAVGLCGGVGLIPGPV